MNLPKDVLLISRLYKEAGKELYVVGGAVRDHLMGKEPKDYDLATNAHPEETIQILKKHFNLLEVGKSFGVIVAVSEGTPDGIEIATFREDSYDNKKDLIDFLEFLDKDSQSKKNAFVELLKMLPK